MKDLHRFKVIAYENGSFSRGDLLPVDKGDILQLRKDGFIEWDEGTGPHQVRLTNWGKAWIEVMDAQPPTQS